VCDVAVVSWPSPRSDRGAACSAESAASRALCVLRDNRERAVASCFPIRGAADLAQVEALAVEQGTQDMGVVDAALGAVSSTSGLRGSFDLSSRSEPVIRGAGCGSSASPDLWEAGESDLPGPPDMPRRDWRSFRRTLISSSRASCTATHRRLSGSAWATVRPLTSNGFCVRTRMRSRHSGSMSTGRCSFSRSSACES
jgi:hypothetical protein